MDRMQLEAATKKLSIFCATCARYWRAREQGLEDTKCLSPGFCASPLGGDEFTHYKGMLPRDGYGRWCFVCGHKAHFALRAHGSDKVFGVCQDHVEVITKYRPVGMTEQAPNASVHHGGGWQRLGEYTVKKKRWTLRQIIAHTERERGPAGGS